MAGSSSAPAPCVSKVTPAGSKPAMMVKLLQVRPRCWSAKKPRSQVIPPTFISAISWPVSSSLLFILLSLSGSAVAAGLESGESAKEKERKLINILNSDAPPEDKAVPCKQLAIYGSKEAVPALAPLLLDPKLASWS